MHIRMTLTTAGSRYISSLLCVVGSLPAAWAQLPALKTLLLYDNQLNGEHLHQCHKVFNARF